MPQRVTFVRSDVDGGQKVADFLIARLSQEQACQHYINEKMFKLMRNNGVKYVVCPMCGVKCTVPQQVEDNDG